MAYKHPQDSYPDPVPVHVSTGTYELLAARVRFEDGMTLNPPVATYEDGTCDLAIHKALVFRLMAARLPDETLEDTIVRVIWTSPMSAPRAKRVVPRKTKAGEYVH